MELSEVYNYLCYYDERNPSYFKEDWDDEVTPPRTKCSCDNCFYGMDRLAMEILRLRGGQGETIPTTQLL